jgi:hypothetical protein
MYTSHTIKLTSAGKKHFGTRKNTLRIVELGEGSTMELNGGYWDGGSRSCYHGMTKSGAIVGLNYPTTPREFGGGDAPKMAMHAGVAIVKGGVFCGKDAHLTIYVTLIDGWMKPEYGVAVVK